MMTQDLKPEAHHIRVAPALVVVPVAVGLLHVERDLEAGGRFVVESVLVQRHGHDGRLAGVARAVALGAGHAADVTVADRLAHDEQIGQTGQIGVRRRPRRESLTFARPTQQIAPLLLACSISWAQSCFRSAGRSAA